MTREIVRTKTGRNASGEGGIRRYRTGWQAYITVGCKSDGSPNRMYFYGKTQQEVRGKMAEARALRDSGRLTRADAGKTTVAQYAARFLDAIRPPDGPGARGAVGRATYEGYVDVLTRIVVPAIGHLRLKDLTAEHLTGLYKSYADRPRMAEYVHVTMHRMLEAAVAAREVPINVAKTAEVIRPPAHRSPAPPSGAGVGRLLTACERCGDPFSALWAILAYTGCRPSEAIALTWPDVQPDRGVIVIDKSRDTRGRDGIGGRLKPTKNETSIREVSVDAALFTYLDRQRERVEALKAAAGEAWDPDGLDLVFPGDGGGPLVWWTVHKHFKASVRAARLPRHTRVYDLRHAHATMLIEAGEQLVLVSKRLGHRSPEVTARIYSHLLGPKDRDLATKAGQCIAAGLAGAL